MVNVMDEVIVLRHRQCGSDPSFSVSSTLDNYFRENTKAHEAVFALPGRDVEGTIGGLPEVSTRGRDTGVPRLRSPPHTTSGLSLSQGSASHVMVTLAMMLQEPSPRPVGSDKYLVFNRHQLSSHRAHVH